MAVSEKGTEHPRLVVPECVEWRYSVSSYPPSHRNGWKLGNSCESCKNLLYFMYYVQLYTLKLPKI